MNKLIKVNSLTDLARKTIEEYVENNSYVYPEDDCLLEYKNKKAGVFVTIYKNKNLRGCIGTISPVTESIILEIIRNAISSCTQDPRFSPVKKEELKDLTYTVSILMPPEPIDSIDLLDPQRYGVIVQSGFNKRGLLLPRLEGINTIEEQLFYAKRKAGILEHEAISLFRFESIEYKE